MESSDIPERDTPELCKICKDHEIDIANGNSISCKHCFKLLTDNDYTMEIEQTLSSNDMRYCLNVLEEEFGALLF
jgi:hypothetical protein